MTSHKSGFTMIELAIAILIGSILTSIALSSYGNARGRFAVRGARDTFVALHARARAQAVELGQNVQLLVDVDGDSVVLRSQAGDVLENIHFSDEHHVDLRASSALRLCMNPRGFADEGCTSFSSATRLEFWQNADSSSVRILPLGQLIYR